MREEVAGTDQRLRDADVTLGHQLGVERVDVEAGDPERCPDVLDVGAQRHLVGADADRVLVDPTQVDAASSRRADDPVGTTRHAGEHGVEEVLVHHVHPG